MIIMNILIDMTRYVYSYIDMLTSHVLSPPSPIYFPINTQSFATHIIL